MATKSRCSQITGLYFLVGWKSGQSDLGIPLGNVACLTIFVVDDAVVEVAVFVDAVFVVVVDFDVVFLDFFTLVVT